MTATHRCLTAALTLSLLGTGVATRAAGPLERPCPMDWRSTPFSQAVHELAAKLNLAYVLDESVSTELAQTPVRFMADHLTGREALRWLARWVGVEAVVMGETVYLAPPGRLPRAWEHDLLDPSAGQIGRARWEQALTRRADITWIDAPLSLVARNISKEYGIDLILPPDVLAGHDLVQIERLQIGLEDLCEALGTALGTQLGYSDGVVTDNRHRDPQTQEAASSPAPAVAAPAGPALPSPLAAPLAIDQPLADWLTFRARLSTATGLDCRLEGTPPGRPPFAQARGSVQEILDAASMLGVLDFQFLRPEGQNAPFLLIQVR